MKPVFKLLPGGDPQKGMVPSTMTPKEAFTGADKTELNHTFYQTEDESVLCGVWECAPCREAIESYPVHEMMSVLSGSVTITVDSEASQTFVAGDVFFLAKGTKCVWEITDTLRKYYMIAE